MGHLNKADALSISKIQCQESQIRQYAITTAYLQEVTQGLQKYIARHGDIRELNRFEEKARAKFLELQRNKVCLVKKLLEGIKRRQAKVTFER